MVGGDGLTPAVVKETDAALKAHGLIKVRVFSDDRTAREAMLASCARNSAAAIQHIGKLLVLWRPMPPRKAEREDAGRAEIKVVKIVKFASNHRRRRSRRSRCLATSA